MALPVNCQTQQESITRQYYQSAKRQEFVIAQKVLESCHNDKHCNRIKAIKDALQEALSQKDAISSAWIASELSLEQQDFLHRYPTVCAVFTLAIGLGVGYYAGLHNQPDPFDEGF